MTHDQTTPAPVEVTAFKPCPNPWGCDHRQQPVCTHMNFDGNSRLRHVVCHSCGLRGPVRETEAEAIAAWNTRHSAPAGEVEPVAWMYTHGSTDHKIPFLTTERDKPFAALAETTETPLYTHPAPPADLVDRIVDALDERTIRACYEHFQHYAEHPCSASALRSAITMALNSEAVSAAIAKHGAA